jgi:hypothetical protein
MQARTPFQRWRGLSVVGVLLVVVGAAWFVLRELRIDPFGAIADTGWPFFVIVPGLVLLGLSLVPTPPRGLGLAIAGAIVSTVGLVLLYQETTAHWESWAYAWTLVGPGAAGLGLLGYGLVYRQRDLVPVGARMVAIAAAMFVVGYWYFESIFATGRAPLDLGTWWPVALVVLGLAVLAAGFVSRDRPSAERPTTAHGAPR